MDVPLPATVGLVGMSWKFLIPVHPGDTLGSRWKLSRKRNVENPEWGLAVWQVDVENQRGELVASGEVARLIAKREQQPAERTGRSRRRRRKGAPAGQTAADVVMAEPVPEPAPADLPSPAARRRRRRGTAEPAAATLDAPQAGSTPPAPIQAPGPAAPEVGTDQGGAAPSEPAPPKRRRRRRPSNGQGGSQPEGGQPQEGFRQPGGQPSREPNQEGRRPPEVPVETGAPAAQPAPAPEPAGTSEPRPSPFTGGDSGTERPSAPRTWPVEEEASGGSGAGGSEEGGLGRVFRRLRRP
jgi:hypothetical protein